LLNVKAACVRSAHYLNYLYTLIEISIY